MIKIVEDLINRYLSPGLFLISRLWVQATWRTNDFSIPRKMKASFLYRFCNRIVKWYRLGWNTTTPHITSKEFNWLTKLDGTLRRGKAWNGWNGFCESAHTVIGLQQHVDSIKLWSKGN
jgi:hypothetical protein